MAMKTAILFAGLSVCEINCITQLHPAHRPICSPHSFFCFLFAWVFCFLGFFFYARSFKLVCM